jgi:hypothetical protein
MPTAQGAAAPGRRRSSGSIRPSFQDSPDPHGLALPGFLPHVAGACAEVVTVVPYAMLRKFADPRGVVVSALPTCAERSGNIVLLSIDWDALQWLRLNTSSTR